MYLKSLEIQGFKSFPDKTILSFDRGMTAVVGPNGSGKSNISDAVKWVLGEQSVKSLRSSKMEDVVFSGTAARKALGFAEVTLRLDNTDRFFDRDEEEISITRRYYRSGDSEYRINGELARLRDVNELFMDTGLGRDGYSMVGQGKIEELVSNKSSDRREIFEEAAGISHYRYRRTDALRRLDQAEENLVRLRDILSELESRVGPLYQQSEKAKKFLVFAEEKKELEIGLWLRTLERSAEQIREQSTRIEIAQSQHKAVGEALEQIIKDSDSAGERAREITLEIEQIRIDSSSLEEQAAALEGEIAVCRNSSDHNHANIERAENEKRREGENDRELAERIKSTNERIEQLNSIIESQNAELESKARSLEADRKKDDSFSSEAEAIAAELDALTLEASRYSIIISSAKSAIEEITARRTSLESGEGGRQNERAELTASVEALKERLSQGEEKITELKNAVAGYSLRAEAKSEKTAAQKRLVDSETIELERKQSRIKMLEEMERNMEGYTGSVKAVMREHKRGSLRGILGALSMLISTEAKYSTAVETALGAAIQNIVTENENDAKRAMYWLKENNAGRATFLPLNTIKGRSLDEKGLDDCFGFVSLACDLVTADAKYQNIISNLLGRTVVAEDIDSAISIAKRYSHRFKIVTLDGQVINAGGSMTGGSRVQNSGFLSRSGEISDLRRDEEKSRQALEQSRERLRVLAEELAKERAYLEGTKGELFRAEEEKIRTESALSLAEGQLASLNAAAKSLDDEKAALEKRITELNENIALAQKEQAEQESLIADAKKRLSSVSSDRESILTAREALNSEIANINLQIVSAVKDIEQGKAEISELEQRRRILGESSSRLDGEIAELRRQNDELNDKISLLSAQTEALRASAEANRERVAALVKDREECEAHANELRRNERDKNEEKEKLSAELVRLEERRATLIKEQEDAERKLFDEYQLTRREAAALNIIIESVTAASKRLSELRGKIRALGSVNVAAIDEYKEVSERYEFLKTQIDDVEKSKAELTKLIAELTGKMAAQFKERFNLINSTFKESFSQLFGGGQAELVLEDPSNVLECGIEIKAQPPGKNVKSISLLSGGEKGLCAIALLFAILKVNPAPFCFFDEVEAALDDVNVTKYARYVRTITSSTQFILITHRRGTMEEADTLYGVTMQEEGVSKLLELKTAAMAAQLGLE